MICFYSSSSTTIAAPRLKRDNTSIGCSVLLNEGTFKQQQQHVVHFWAPSEPAIRGWSFVGIAYCCWKSWLQDFCAVLSSPTIDEFQENFHCINALYTEAHGHGWVAQFYIACHRFEWQFWYDSAAACRWVGSTMWWGCRAVRHRQARSLRHRVESCAEAISHGCCWLLSRSWTTVYVFWLFLKFTNWQMDSFAMHVERYC